MSTVPSNWITIETACIMHIAYCSLHSPVLKVEFFQVLQAFARAEKKLKPNWKEMFTEVNLIIDSVLGLYPY